MVRGELFKRYPNAIVYAGKAKRSSTGQLELDDSDERYPLFRGTLSPDMTFLGFNLTAADARGGTFTSPDGFFFVFQEQPSEPRFGLEPTAAANPVTQWSDLAWTNFATGGGPSVLQLPLANRSQSAIMASNPWRQSVARIFAGPSKLPAPQTLFRQPPVPAGVAIATGSDDANNQWGVNSAQTAYILLRLPFRVLIHADLMLPNS